VSSDSAKFAVDLIEGGAVAATEGNLALASRILAAHFVLHNAEQMSWVARLSDQHLMFSAQVEYNDMQMPPLTNLSVH
jgi:hypothetical protein